MADIEGVIAGVVHHKTNAISTPHPPHHTHSSVRTVCDLIMTLQSLNGALLNDIASMLPEDEATCLSLVSRSMRDTLLGVVHMIVVDDPEHALMQWPGFITPSAKSLLWLQATEPLLESPGDGRPYDQGSEGALGHHLPPRSILFLLVRWW